MTATTPAELAPTDVDREFAALTREAESPVMDEHQAAQYLGVSVTWLRNNRRSDTTPPFLKYGSKLIRYLQSDLDEWLAAQRVR